MSGRESAAGYLTIKGINTPVYKYKLSIIDRRATIVLLRRSRYCLIVVGFVPRYPSAAILVDDNNSYARTNSFALAAGAHIRIKPNQGKVAVVQQMSPTSMLIFTSREWRRNLRSKCRPYFDFAILLAGSRLT